MVSVTFFSAVVVSRSIVNSQNSCSVYLFWFLYCFFFFCNAKDMFTVEKKYTFHLVPVQRLKRVRIVVSDCGVTGAAECPQ